MPWRVSSVSRSIAMKVKDPPYSAVGGEQSNPRQGWWVKSRRSSQWPRRIQICWCLSVRLFEPLSVTDDRPLAANRTQPM